MENAAPPQIRLADYRPSPYLIDQVSLDFALAPEKTRVVSRLALRPNPKSQGKGTPLVLDGEDLSLISIAIGGRPLDSHEYVLGPTSLTISNPPATPFTLEIIGTCDPKANTQLSGLYMSSGILCTQCEAEGFRRITWYLDRPDVMARFKVRIEASKATCPVLLSNGNPIEAGDIAGTDRHYAIWDDPHPKPAYLFALVAGDLAHVADHFVTRSGRNVELRIYVEKGKEDRCAFAMQALKDSMRWDEEKFGREYDLDVFMIVAVPDFNMGAMENKGLNVFNDKYILALPETATDADFINVEAIIAHEYFHNWTGNRITCRDWFQLCLKEGLTVFRDQEFTADMRSRPVKRIADVKRLRSDQFPEDAGPLAHPPRPSAYIEINNFYTATVYEKGAEVCRMLKTLIGDAAFARGMDLYFERHDGEAATVEEFVQCFADASGRDLTQFFRWYEQAGTPELIVDTKYDRTAKTFDLTIEQHLKPTPGQSIKEPMHMPLRLGLVNEKGEDMPLDLEGTGVLNAPVIELKDYKTTFRFRNVASRPALSLNRGFSAPVKIAAQESLADTLFLLGHDGDPFNRWEAAQRAGTRLIGETMETISGGGEKPATEGLTSAISRVLSDARLDTAFKAQMLTLPSESDMASAVGTDVDPDLIFAARHEIAATIGRALKGQLAELWKATSETGPYRPDPASTGRRALRQACLHLIAAADPEKGAQLAMQELANPASMTAEIGALSALILTDRPERDAALEQFYDRHRSDHLLVDKWFSLNAQLPGPAAPQRISALMQHPDFKLTAPNRLRSLIGVFAMANQTGFHAVDGAGYDILADTILALDPLNPQVAARLATNFRSWRIFEPKRRALAAKTLGRILAQPRLSRDTFEIASKSLGQGETRA
ncbi:MAG: aminopeptidase N [Rhizobiales bacterium]|nr:aminopeptidase N [Hyphomicrobiales bacterium]